MISGKIAKMAEAVPNYPGRSAWETALQPLLEPVTKKYAGTVIERLLGYWVLVHTFGGREEVVEMGLLGKATAYKREAEFEKVFGKTVYDLPPSKIFKDVKKT